MIALLTGAVIGIAIGWGAIIAFCLWAIIKLGKIAHDHDCELEAIAKEMNWSYDREHQKISRRQP